MTFVKVNQQNIESKPLVCMALHFSDEVIATIEHQ
jgi:hypothetical protein